MVSTALDDRAHRGQTAREYERDARRRYEAVVAAARESLRRAQKQFEQSSAVIDSHIYQALAALAGGIRRPLQGPASSTVPQSLTGSAASRIRSSGPSRSAPQGGARTVPAGTARPTLSPAPSRLLA